MLRQAILCLLSCWILAIHAQSLGTDAFDVMSEDYTFRTLPQTPQLYGVSVNDMLEDHDGYLWIATSSGFYRYDGYTLRNQHDIMPDDIRADAMSLTVQEDGNSHLWVSMAANSEYVVLDERRARVSTADYLRELGIETSQQVVIHVAQQGDIWAVVQDSLWRYSCATHQVRSYNTKGLTTSGFLRLSLCSDGDLLYIIDGLQLRTFDESQNTWTEERLPLDIPYIDNNVDGVKLACAYLDKAGNLWMHSLFSEEVVVRRRYSHDWQHVDLPHGSSHEQNFIRGIADAPTGGVWIATNHRGLFLCNPESGKIVHYEYHLNDTHCLLSNNVNAIAVDSHGTLWVGYFKGGFSYCRPAGDDGAFTIHEFGDINAIAVTGGGMRWYGSDGRGLWRERDGQVTHVDKFPNVVITDLQCAPDGSLWIGTYNQGLYHLESGFRLHHYSASNGTLPHDGAQHLAIDGYGNIWVSSTFCPFYRLDVRTGRWQTFRDENGVDLMGNDVCYDPLENCVILASYWGLWIHNLKTDKATRVMGAQHGQLPLHDYQEHLLMADPSHHMIWMAHGQGVTVWDGSQDTLYLLSAEDGLTSKVLSFCKDPQHNVWVSSASGLAVIQPHQTAERTWRFTVRHVLSASQEMNAPFNLKAAAVTPDGRMLFGMLDAYYDIDSRSILSHQDESVRPSFSTILVGDSVVYAERQPTGQLLLQLEYNPLPTTFSFYTGNPLNAQSVHYSYRILGLQEAWVETTANSISLLTLPSGSYEFELKAMGPNAEWSEVTTLYIEVCQPWWNATWVRLVTSLLVLLVGILSVVWRLGKDNEQYIQQQEVQLHDKQQKQIS